MHFGRKAKSTSAVCGSEEHAECYGLLAAIVRTFCEQRSDETIDLKTVAADTLSSLVASFYTDAQTKDGAPFSKKNSLKAARGAIQRHLTTVGRQVNIFTDSDFTRANKVLDGVLKQRKRDGLERQVQHKTPITEEDWLKLKAYFRDVLEANDAVKLTFYVWFSITIHFCLRGGEMQAAICKNDLVFSQVNGKEVIKLAPSYMSKNHQGGLLGSDWTSAGIIEYEHQVAVIKFYLTKLHPDVDRLFQRAMSSCTLPEQATRWYMRMPLSRNLLSTMMKRLSSAADLSKPYTNHCVRATSITHLKQSGVGDRQICSVSGHKNVQSLEAYDRPSDSDAVRMASAIELKPVTHAVSLPSASVISESSNVLSASSTNTVSSVTSAAISPYLNATGSASFLNCPITFNIQARAEKARKMMKLKRRHE